MTWVELVFYALMIPVGFYLLEIIVAMVVRCIGTIVLFWGGVIALIIEGVRWAARKIVATEQK
jgi:hypothetical protein